MKLAELRSQVGIPIGRARRGKQMFSSDEVIHLQRLMFANCNTLSSFIQLGNLPCLPNNRASLSLTIPRLQFWCESNMSRSCTHLQHIYSAWSVRILKISVYFTCYNNFSFPLSRGNAHFWLGE